MFNASATTRTDLAQHFHKERRLKHTPDAKGNKRVRTKRKRTHGNNDPQPTRTNADAKEINKQPRDFKRKKRKINR